MDFIAVDDQVGDGSLGVGAVDGDAESVAATAGGIATGEGIFDVMDVIFEEFDVGAGAGDADAQWSEAMLGSVKVANFEALDSDVTLVVDCENAASGGGREMRGVQDCGFAWIASEGDEAVAGISGCVDANELFVDSTANVDGRAGAGFVYSVLDRAPRSGFSAGIRIISSRGYVEGSVGLAMCSGDAHK